MYELIISFGKYSLVRNDDAKPLVLNNETTDFATDSEKEEFLQNLSADQRDLVAAYYKS